MMKSIMKKILFILSLILLIYKPVFAMTYDEVYQYVVRTSEKSSACVKLLKTESPGHFQIYLDRWNRLMTQAKAIVNGNKDVNNLLYVGQGFNNIMLELKTNYPDPTDPCNQYE